MPWRVIMHNRAVLGKRQFFFGQFKTEEIANEIVHFIYNCDLPMTSTDEVEKLRSFVRSWAIAKGYLNQSPNQKQRSAPVQSFSFISTLPRKETNLCQTQ